MLVGGGPAVSSLRGDTLRARLTRGYPAGAGRGPSSLRVRLLWGSRGLHGDARGGRARCFVSTRGYPAGASSSDADCGRAPHAGALLFLCPPVVGPAHAVSTGMLVGGGPAVSSLRGDTLRARLTRGYPAGAGRGPSSLRVRLLWGSRGLHGDARGGRARCFVSTQGYCFVFTRGYPAGAGRGPSSLRLAPSGPVNRVSPLAALRDGSRALTLRGQAPRGTERSPFRTSASSCRCLPHQWRPGPPFRGPESAAGSPSPSACRTHSRMSSSISVIRSRSSSGSGPGSDSARSCARSRSRTRLRRMRFACFVSSTSFAIWPSV